MADAKQFQDRLLSLGLARVSEAAALASATLIGRGDEKAADQAAVMAETMENLPNEDGYGQWTADQFTPARDGHLDATGLTLARIAPERRLSELAFDFATVRVDLAATHGEEPLAALHHLLGDQGEARLVGGPGIPQPEACTQHHQRDQQQPAERSLIEQETVIYHDEPHSR